jgi:hypothetical protein
MLRHGQSNRIDHTAFGSHGNPERLTLCRPLSLRVFGLSSRQHVPHQFWPQIGLITSILATYKPILAIGNYFGMHHLMQVPCTMLCRCQQAQFLSFSLFLNNKLYFTIKARARQALSSTVPKHVVPSLRRDRTSPLPSLQALHLCAPSSRSIFTAPSSHLHLKNKPNHGKC